MRSLDNMTHMAKETDRSRIGKVTHLKSTDGERQWATDNS